MKRSIDGINTQHVPCVNGINSFSLDQYQNRDNSRQKRKAAAWGAGDFASVLRQNMDKYCDDYSIDSPQEIKLKAKRTKENKNGDYNSELRPVGDGREEASISEQENNEQ